MLSHLLVVLLSAGSVAAGDLAFAESADKSICAAAYEECTDIESCTKMYLAHCEDLPADRSTASDATISQYAESYIAGLAFVNEAKYQENMEDPDFFELPEPKVGYRDSDDNPTYAYVSAGAVFGNDESYAYVASPTYLIKSETGVSSSTMSVKVAGPGDPPTLDDEAPSGPYTVCIDNTDTALDNCDTKRTFKPNSFEFGIYGHTGGTNLEAFLNTQKGAGRQHMLVRQQLRLKGGEINNIYFNGDKTKTLDKIGTTDVTKMTIVFDEGNTIYDFPTSYNIGPTPQEVPPEGKILPVTRQAEVKIRVTKAPGVDAIYLDYLFAVADIGMEGNKGTYFIYDPDATTTNTDGGDGDNPCFSRDATVCRILQGPAAGAEVAAFDACYNSKAAGAAIAERVALSEVTAGDRLLTLADDSSLSSGRVIAMQHAHSTEAAALLKLHHAHGELAVTPDHLLSVNGKIAPAYEAIVGSHLQGKDNTIAEVTRVEMSSGRIVNPLLTTGTLLAAGDSGVPVLATNYGEWFAKVYPVVNAQWTLASLLSFVFPASVQRFYDALVEPLFPAGPTSMRSHIEALKNVIHPALYPLVFVTGDVTVAAAFLGSFLFQPHLLVTIVLAVAVGFGARRK